MNNAIIVDIDGTLTSDFGGVPNKPIIDLVSRYAIDHDILILTHRPSNELGYTEEWLKENNIKYNKIWAVDDKVKFYEEFIKDNWDITFVLEDNKKNINGFRKLGVKTLEVNEQLCLPNNILNPKSYYNNDNIIYKRPQELHDCHLSVVSMLKGKTILDAGSGNGLFIPTMLDKGMEVTAIDYSKPSIENIKKKYPEIKAYVHDFKYPIPEYRFDQVLCHLALHYLEDWISTLNEFKRLTDSIILCLNHPFYTGSFVGEYKESQIANIPFGHSKEYRNYMPVFHKSLEIIHSIFDTVGLTVVDLKEPREQFILYELQSKRS